MKITTVGSLDSFYNAILFGIFSKLSDDGEKKNSVIFEETNIENLLVKNFYDRLKDKKDGLFLGLNLPNFQRQCHETNHLLIEKRFFLRVYELKINLDI